MGGEAGVFAFLFQRTGPIFYVWTVLGFTGGILFYGRFYLQWIASERKKESVIPAAFWYVSSVGSVLLLFYAFYERSPVGALGQTFGLLVYSRNLIHIKRNRDGFAQWKSVTITCLVSLAVVAAIAIAASTWWSEYEFNKDMEAGEAGRTWFWLGVGVVGQILFAGRFLVQWIATETRRKSVVPTAFWYLSVAAAALQAGCFFQRGEWIFAAGMVATILIYLRNLWFIHGRQEASAA